MVTKSMKQAIGRRLMTAFCNAGATEVAPDILLDAATLLDLYGEDIRARAYITFDPIRGEVVLRPDFTVPVVRMHMAGGAEAARYCYLGEVFRKQDYGDTHPDNPLDNEYLQAGFEVFTHTPDTDAEVFALFHQILLPYNLQATMGGMDILLDAVRNLPTSLVRQTALLHHIWRPKRFSRLLEQFSVPVTLRHMNDISVSWTGLRSSREVEDRVSMLIAEKDETPLPQVWRNRLDRLFAIDAPAPKALEQLHKLTTEIPAIEKAVDRLEIRLQQITERGIDLSEIRFAASHGRETMEYYDGMTFTFTARHRVGPPIASGGRYDALTTQLGAGRTIPAVGGIIRPGLLAELEAQC